MRFRLRGRLLRGVRLGEQRVEVVLDVLDELGLERLQQEAQRHFEVDLGLGDTHLALHAAAAEVQCVAGPLTGEVVLLGQVVGGLLHQRRAPAPSAASGT